MACSLPAVDTEQARQELARQFIRSNHRAVLVTHRPDGRLQTSPVIVGIDDEGWAAISSRETAFKVHNLRHDPRATLCVFSDEFYGPWLQIEGAAQIVSLPIAMEPLVSLYRSIAGEHPDWDEYRASMKTERRLCVRIPLDIVGPKKHG